MLNRFLGNFLVKKKLLSEEQLTTLLSDLKGYKASVPTIAFVMKVLDQKQVEECLKSCDGNKAQFGEKAVELGMLTDDRLEYLLTFQENLFAVFIEKMIEQKLITYQQLVSVVTELQLSRKWSENQLHALIQWDVPLIVDMFVPLRSPQLKSLTVTFVDYVKKYIDPNMYLEKAYVSNAVSLTGFSAQEMKGDFRYTLYLSGEGNSLLGIANHFSGLTFSEVNEDTLDNICEFINCVNGQFATDMSYDNIDIDMEAPFYNVGTQSISNGRVYVIPFHVNGCDLQAVYEVHE